MKKFIFLLVILIGILVGNFLLRNAHIKYIESSLNEMQKKFSDLGITFGISKLTSTGKFFWNIALDSEIEIYATAADCILYFYIPNIKIYSAIKWPKDVDIDIVFPNKITGHLDLNPEIAGKFTLEKKYTLFLESLNIPSASIKKKNLTEDGIISFNLEDVLIDFQSTKLREKFISIESIKMQNNDISSNQSQLNVKVNNLNIYLDQARFGKYLSKNMTLDDASKNIAWELNLLKTDNTTTDAAPKTIYSGNMDCITRIFEIKVDGEDRVLKTNPNNSTHKADLNFKIKNFDVFIDYATSVFLSNKNTELEKAQIIEVSNLFKKSIKDHAIQNGDITSFKIKDTDDNKTLFEGVQIHDVFKEPLDKLSEYN
jgi:hypothetical protein